MEENLKSEKFIMNGDEYVRVDGIWFQYIEEDYIPLRDTISLEQLYKEKCL